MAVTAAEINAEAYRREKLRDDFATEARKAGDAFKAWEKAPMDSIHRDALEAELVACLARCRTLRHAMLVAVLS